MPIFFQANPEDLMSAAEAQKEEITQLLWVTAGLFVLALFLIAFLLFRRRKRNAARPVSDTQPGTPTEKQIKRQEKAKERAARKAEAEAKRAAAKQEKEAAKAAIRAEKLLKKSKAKAPEVKESKPEAQPTAAPKPDANVKPSPEPETKSKPLAEKPKPETVPTPTPQKEAPKKEVITPPAPQNVTPKPETITPPAPPKEASQTPAPNRESVKSQVDDALKVSKSREENLETLRKRLAEMGIEKGAAELDAQFSGKAATPPAVDNSSKTDLSETKKAEEAPIVNKQDAETEMPKAKEAEASKEVIIDKTVEHKEDKVEPLPPLEAPELEKSPDEAKESTKPAQTITPLPPDAKPTQGNATKADLQSFSDWLQKLKEK